MSKTNDSDAKIRLYRLHKIDDLIRAETYPSAEQLAKELEVSLRTINRDLDMLRDFYDAPLQYDSMRHGWHYTEPNFFIKYIPLKEGELFSLALFDTLLCQYTNTPFERQLRNIFKKIAASLPDSVSVDARFFSQDITYIPDSLAPIDETVFDAIMNALKLHCSLCFDYEPLQKTTYMARKIDPYHVICQRGNWYVIGFCHLKQDIRIFNFSRMKNPITTNKRFAVPADFDLASYIDRAMGVWASSRTPTLITLRFAAEIGTFAKEHVWHENQTVHKNTDGTVDVSFTTTQLPEVKRLVLGQGKTVQVLSPPQLIEEIQAECRAMLDLYQQSDSASRLQQAQKF